MKKTVETNWLVQVGYATGSLEQGNASWFLVEKECYNMSKKKAIETARKIGYTMNKDICADWIFSCIPLVHG